MRIIVDGSRELIATDEGLTCAEELPRAAVGTAQHINLAFNTMTNLQGLESATSLRNLNLSDNAIHSLLGVDAFVQLRRLRCSNNQISDLTPLESLPNLEELWINNNQIQMAQLAHLSRMKTLHTLVLHPNPCTNDVNYTLYVIKQVPWITRLDLAVVDDNLRQRSLHFDDRLLLSSAASDASEISMMTTRSNDDPSEVRSIESSQVKEAMSTPSNTSTPVDESDKTLKKKKKKMTAEDFMRAFPVQEFIPPRGSIADAVVASAPDMAVQLNASSPERDDVPTSSPAADDQPEIPEYHDSNQATLATDQEVAPIKQDSPIASLAATRSSILSAVMDLPFMKSDMTTKKKTITEKSIEKPKAVKKTTSVKSTTASVMDPTLASFHQQELVISYPNSTVYAVQIRSDGSALAKWPSGNVAVSVDRERDGFRCYAAHKDGTIALSLDASGVGFINYYPSGRMMISTSSGGEGLYFSNDGFTILRQWNSDRLNDDKGMPVSSLSDAEADGSLALKLSDGLGVRVRLSEGKDARPSMLQLKIYFSSGTGVRHAFSNWINVGEPNGNECDAIFGQPPKQAKKAKNVAKASLSDTLHSIRAAVAGLQ